MSIKYSRLVLDRSQSKGTDLLVLLVLADFSNESGLAWPSVATLARTCRMTPRNLNLRLAKLRESGEVEVGQNAGQAGSNLYRIAIQPPEADFTPPLKPTSSPPEAGFPQPLKPASDNPPMNHQEDKESANKSAPTPPKVRKKSKALPLGDWLAQCTASGEKAIGDDDPVRSYCATAGIPADFLVLAWAEFRHRYTQPGAKVYTDWRQVFRNAVRGHWLKLWFLDDYGQCQLTTAGKQALHHQENAE